MCPSQGSVDIQVQGDVEGMIVRTGQFILAYTVAEVSYLTLRCTHSPASPFWPR